MAPALRRLLAPLRLARFPVDELATAVALTVRCLSLLVDELRTLQAARHVRRAAPARGVRPRLVELQDLLVAALVVAMRRARELGQAIDARGGGALHDEGVHLGVPDAVTFAVAAAAVVLMTVVLP